MKIAVLSAANSIHTVKIVNSLCDLGHQIVLYSLLRHFDKDGAIDKRVDVVYLEKKSYLSNKNILKEHLRLLSPDVLYVHYATGYGSLARKTGFHPCVLAVWGSDIYDFPKKSIVHRKIVKDNLKFADKIFSTSNIMAAQTQKYTEKEILITPFGVDLDEFYPAKTKEYTDLVRIGFVKGVSKTYGIEYLIRAFSALTKKYPNLNVILDVYGGGSQLEEMKQLVKNLNISSKVTFYGYIPHEKVADVLRGFDVFCVPSIRESFGVSAVEAMACGLPCIVSDADGLTEVSVDYKTGYIFPKCDVNALTDALDKLVHDAKLREEMGVFGRKRVEELYDWNNNILTIEKGLSESLHK